MVKCKLNRSELTLKLTPELPVIIVVIITNRYPVTTPTTTIAIGILNCPDLRIIPRLPPVPTPASSQTRNPHPLIWHRSRTPSLIPNHPELLS